MKKKENKWSLQMIFSQDPRTLTKINYVYVLGWILSLINLIQLKYQFNNAVNIKH